MGLIADAEGTELGAAINSGNPEKVSQAIAKGERPGAGHLGLIMLHRIRAANAGDAWVGQLTHTKEALRVMNDDVSALFQPTSMEMHNIELCLLPRVPHYAKWPPMCYFVKD